MKKYEKPMIMIMPLEGNEQLCGSCANAGLQLSNPGPDNMGMVKIWDMMFGNNNGTLEKADFQNMFGNNEKECTNKVDRYCKFTSAENGQILVAWS